MNSTIAQIINQGTSSRSTDKLALVIAGLELIPQNKLEKLKSIHLTWQDIDPDTIVPFLDIEFFS